MNAFISISSIVIMILVYRNHRNWKSNKVKIQGKLNVHDLMTYTNSWAVIIICGMVSLIFLLKATNLLQ